MKHPPTTFVHDLAGRLDVARSVRRPLPSEIRDQQHQQWTSCTRARASTRSSCWRYPMPDPPSEPRTAPKRGRSDARTELFEPAVSSRSADCCRSSTKTTIANLQIPSSRAVSDIRPVRSASPRATWRRVRSTGDLVWAIEQVPICQCQDDHRRRSCAEKSPSVAPRPNGRSLMHSR
jgi:hypothetical protein